jgi:hypothetical protein
MTISARIFPRASEPDLTALNATLRPLLPVTPSTGDFNSSWDGNANVVVLYGDWSGVDLQAVQNAITACVQRTYRTDAKVYIDNMDTPLKAAFLVILDEVNTIRTKTGVLPIGAARTQNQFFQAIKDKIDTL